MSKLYCRQSSQFLPIFTELEDLRSTCIANCVFNIFLLLSLACLDVAVGLFSQPLYTVFLINWLRLDNPSCNTQQVRTISSSLFSAALFLGVVAVSVDRLLAVHLHLRYQELVTHRRVVIVVIGIWPWCIVYLFL